MLRLGESAARGYLAFHQWVTKSSLLRRVGNASYFSSFEMQERMLADTRRLEAYSRAITRYVREGDVVIDLGTGTGILAFLAYHQKPSKIYAVDHSGIIEHARHVAGSNRLCGIEFVKKHSESFEPAEKVDVIVQEQMGSWLFNENMVECVLDLRNRVLKPGGRILPNRFEVFFEPVQLSRQSHVPLIWENKIHGIDFSCLENAAKHHRNSTIMLQPHDFSTLLADPKPVVSFDLESLTHEKEIPSQWHYRKRTNGGALNGFVLYFKAFFGDDIVLDTTPTLRHECIAQRRLPFYRTPSVRLEEGDEISVDVCASDLVNPRSWSWSHSTAPGAQ
ncbi:MAG: class I SAM-dependent methyltransferase [Armatimonadetes bacterium]|nr:class I SAM-dependent methyltransferase [Armatimonadota bacterium]